MSLPQTMTALVVGGAGKYQLSCAVPVPRPGPGLVLCKVRAVAVNPADWKMVDFSATANAIGGQEFAGEVLQIGDGVTAVQPGDHVLAPAATAGHGSGAFCEYTLVAEDMLAKLPPSLSFEDAAGISIAYSTAMLALYQKLDLPLPQVLPASTTPAPVHTTDGKPVYVLVSGGATATGTMAIQLLRASGLTPVATCSPENRALLLSLGAVETFDYHAPTCGIAIRTFTNNTLAHVLDCVTQAESMKLAYEAIGPAGGRYVALDPFPTRIQYSRRDVRADWILSYTLLGQPVHLAGTFGRPARPQDRLFATQLFALLERLMAQGSLHPHPVELRPGGLASVSTGVEDVRLGRVRAHKLVYTVA